MKEEYQQNHYPVDCKQQELFDTIQLEYDTMISYYKQFDIEGWILDKEEKGVTLEYKVFEEDQQIAIRISS